MPAHTVAEDVAAGDAKVLSNGQRHLSVVGSTRWGVAHTQAGNGQRHLNIVATNGLSSWADSVLLDTSSQTR